MKYYTSCIFSIILTVLVTISGFAQKTDKIKSQIDELASEVEPTVIEWRHHLHQYPELSNREFKTAAFIAEKLQSFGLEVQTGIAHTGVVGILKGGKPGPVIGLRADIDALPVTERVPLEWASKEVAEYNGQKVGVMHACGHDTHTSILLGTAKVLSELKDDLQGTVKFIFQPAEEGAPEEEEGGAELMIKEGVLKNPDVDVIFGLHIWSTLETGKIGYKPEGTMAAANSFHIKVKGKQTHGSRPWGGIDPIVTSAMIINGLQTTVSRQAELTQDPAVVTVGAIHGGVRSNIIPEEVEMIGTIRTFDGDMREKIFKDIERTATMIAASQGAIAEVSIKKGYPVTYNDPELTELMVPSLEVTAGKENVILQKAITGAEDFSFYQKEVPGLFFFLGGMPKGMDSEEAYPHHTPDFFVTDDSLILGIRSFCNLVIDYPGKIK
jgi:amidohydrolase